MADPYSNPYSNPYGSQGQHPTHSAAPYGGYWPQDTGAADRNSPRIQLVWAILVLGLATYLISYAAVSQPGGTGWGVRFSTLAAVVAALGLLPRQRAHTKLMVALAVMGFLDALSQLTVGDHHPGRATIVIVVLNGLQALTAIAALLAQLRVRRQVDRGLPPEDAYSYYAQAAQHYYADNYRQLAQQQPVFGQGMAQADVAAPAQAQQSAAQRYPLYAEYLTGQQSGPNPAASPPQSGAPTYTAQPAAGTGIPTSGAAEGIRPADAPVRGAADQPWPS